MARLVFAPCLEGIWTATENKTPEIGEELRGKLEPGSDRDCISKHRVLIAISTLPPLRASPQWGAQQWQLDMGNLLGLDVRK
jgi:hypothetical protein